MLCLGILWIMLVPFESIWDTVTNHVSSSFLDGKVGTCELLSMDFPLTRNYSLAKDIFARCSCCQCFRIVAVAGAGKTTTCIKLADRLLRQDPDLRIASLGLSLRWDEGSWNTLELETLASCLSLGFLWRGGKWMGDDGFLRFGFVWFSFCKGWQWFELQEASIFVNFCFDACGGWGNCPRTSEFTWTGLQPPRVLFLRKFMKFDSFVRGWPWVVLEFSGGMWSLTRRPCRKHKRAFPKRCRRVQNVVWIRTNDWVPCLFLHTVGFRYLALVHLASKNSWVWMYNAYQAGGFTRLISHSFIPARLWAGEAPKTCG